MEIVLVEPEIPQNTGNIARTCAATGSVLHLIKPLGFSVDEKSVRRAGLDYWKDVDVRLWENFSEFWKEYSDRKLFFATTKALNTYADVSFPKDAVLVFGRETKGLPEDLLKENKESCIRIPMIESQRSLNLSNAVAVVLYEALRQNGFLCLQKESDYFSKR